MYPSVRTQAAVPLTEVNALVVWDGDDTLWFVEQLYDEARAAVAGLVAAAGLDADAWDGVQRLIDIENVERLGLTRRRFPTSCVEALERVATDAGVVLSPAVRDAAWSLADKVFTSTAPLAEHVLDVLATVGDHARMVLVTKGDPSVQASRIATSGLAGHFESVLIVPEKTPATFRAIAELCGVPVEDCWSVGNSLPSDVNPALSAGMSAIWVDAHVWGHERRETVPLDGRLHAAASLKEAAEILLDEVA